MTAPLLPQQPAPVTLRDARLTAEFLLSARPALNELFLALRTETDLVLEQELGAKYGKPYPLGCCQEITLDVLRRLRGRLTNADHAGIRALKRFLAAGGTGRCVWGVLRNRYFQTALQFGDLYVDTSNDTVDPTKPKIEILPFEEAGLEAVRGPGHFAEIAGTYWGARMYANHAVPSLAPLLPMIALRNGAQPVLYSASRYMTELMRRDAFVQAEAWLAEEGHAPPQEAIAALRASCPPEILAANPVATAEAAVHACRDARAAGAAADPRWRDACLAAYRAIGMTPAS